MMCCDKSCLIIAESLGLWGRKRSDHTGARISRKDEFGCDPMSTCGLRKEWESVGVADNGISMDVGREG